jgi:hypothetical protein
MALVYSDLTRTEVHFPGSFDNMPLLALVAGIRSWMHLVNATYGWTASLSFYGFKVLLRCVSVFITRLRCAVSYLGLDPLIQRINLEVLCLSLQSVVKVVIEPRSVVVEEWKHFKAAHEPKKMLKELGSAYKKYEPPSSGSHVKRLDSWCLKSPDSASRMPRDIRNLAMFRPWK